VAISDVFASFGGDLVLGLETECFVGGGEATNLLAEGASPNNLVLWVFEKMPVLKKVTGVVVKNRLGPVA
jgi:hypothetical protein